MRSKTFWTFISVTQRLYFMLYMIYWYHFINWTLIKTKIENNRLKNCDVIEYYAFKLIRFSFNYSVLGNCLMPLHRMSNCYRNPQKSRVYDKTILSTVQCVNMNLDKRISLSKRVLTLNESYSLGCVFILELWWV